MKKEVYYSTHPANAFTEFCNQQGKVYKDYIYLELRDYEHHNLLSNFGWLLSNNPNKVIIYCNMPLGKLDTPPAVNNIKRQYGFERNIQKGSKDWKTVYVIIEGHPEGRGAVVSDSEGKKFFDTKKEAEDIAKEYTAEHAVDTHVIIGKTPANFSRLQTTVQYKTDQKFFNEYEIYYHG